MADKRLQKAKPKIHCPYCGEDKYDDNFYNTKSLFFPSGKLPYCKSCMKELYDKYYRSYEIKKDPHADQSALKRLCSVCDMYYCDKLYKASLKEMEKSPEWDIVSAFFKNRNLPQYSKKDWGNTLAEMETEIAERTISDIEIANRENEDELANIPQDTINRFGKGFSAEDYEFLQDQYGDWVTRHECNTKAQEEIFKNICFNRLLYHKAVVNGEDTKALSDEFNKLLDSGKLQPKQNSSDAISDAQTFGTLIDKWENERPIPEVDEELRDVDKIGLYLDVFFRGHLAKMMGLKNGISHLYDKYMSKYTVKKQEYDLDDDSDSLFDSIFGTASNLEKD